MPRPFAELEQPNGSSSSKWHLPWLTELREMRESEAYVERDQEKDPDRDDPVSD